MKIWKHQPAWHVVINNDFRCDEIKYQHSGTTVVLIHNEYFQHTAPDSLDTSQQKVKCPSVGRNCERYGITYHPFDIIYNTSQWIYPQFVLPGLLGPFYQHSLTLIPAWVSNYVHYNVWDEIIYPFPTSMVKPLKFGNGYIISSHTLSGILLLIHLGIKVNVC